MRMGFIVSCQGSRSDSLVTIQSWGVDNIETGNTARDDEKQRIKYQRPEEGETENIYGFLNDMSVDR
jgi:hypothetical protein